MHERGKLLRPLAVPMAEDTSRKVQQLITVLHNEHHINEMTEKWLCQTPNPPRIPVFYTLTKIHKPTWETLGVSGVTEKLSAFVAILVLQPLVASQRLIQSTDSINFIDRTESSREHNPCIYGRNEHCTLIFHKRGNTYSMQGIRHFLY